MGVGERGIAPLKLFFKVGKSLFYEFKSATIFNNNDTITQLRFNALSFLHAHKQLLDGLDLLFFADDFVSLNDIRSNYFGTLYLSISLCYSPCVQKYRGCEKTEFFLKDSFRINSLTNSTYCSNTFPTRSLSLLLLIIPFKKHYKEQQNLDQWICSTFLCEDSIHL